MTKHKSLLTQRWMLLAAAIAVLANYIPSTKVTWLIGESVMNLSIAFVVYWATTGQPSAIGRALNWPPLVFIGVLSYSLYLYQQPFTHYGVNNGLAAFPQNIPLIVLAALASYLLIEVPFLRLRTRLEASIIGSRSASQPAPHAHSIP